MASIASTCPTRWGRRGRRSRRRRSRRRWARGTRRTPRARAVPAASDRASVLVEQPVEQRDEPVVVVALLGEVARRTGRAGCGRGAPRSRRRGERHRRVEAHFDDAVPAAAPRTSSASPARAGSSHDHRAGTRRRTPPASAAQLGQRAPHGARAARRASSGTVRTLAGVAGVASTTRTCLASPRFAEVELERRAAVPDRARRRGSAGRGGGGRAPRSGRSGKAVAGTAVVEDGLGVALAAAERAAGHAVGDDEVDRVGAEAGRRAPSMQRRASARRSAGVLGGVAGHQLAARTT